MQQNIAHSIECILKNLGEDTNREGLVKTPLRVEKSLQELTSGMHTDPKSVALDALFDTCSSGVILQKGIEFFSLCEHHMLPFFGNIHLAYIPNGKIIGLSKIGRIIDILSKRLQVQENLTHQIIQTLQELLNPKGIAIYVEAQHFCMMMRGVKKQQSITITTDFFGSYNCEAQLKDDFFASIKD